MTSHRTPKPPLRDDTAAGRSVPPFERFTFHVERCTFSPSPFLLSPFPRSRPAESASVLIIVLWIAFGLVSIALYFAHAMQLEHRAGDNRVAAAEAEQAILGALRYVTYELTNLPQPGQPPDSTTLQSEAIDIGPAQYWLLGRTNRSAGGANSSTSATAPTFGLIDEASKLNLNTATQAMLEALPRMTPELAAAIIDWRDANSEVTPGGAEDETYQRKNPAYRCKNAPFESVDELRLVNGATLEILYGEDTNRNGVLDDNENDGPASLPDDNRDGRLDPGITEYVTVWSREPNTRTNGEPRIVLATAGQRALPPLLLQKFGAERSNAILRRIGNNWNFTSTLQFYARSGLTADEFTQIAKDITTTNTPFLSGRVNVNTASEAVLTCIPGIGKDKAASLVSFRQSNATKLTSIAWVTEVLEPADIAQAGPFLTTESYQFTADIAAVGHYGRGYQRVRFVLDTTELTDQGAPKILYHQDLTHLGWALGKEVRQNLLAALDSR
ncbi:hypothetical protein LBMAG56_49900 [Verrucomicrobiota bacterium]|nr:hypothetical protein LBMAG56_49900 [Verrucomicrobiota bacterium]